MQHIQQITLKEGSQEELLPDFSDDFPYMASHVEMDPLRRSSIPWHWHRAVELFYIESGCLEYDTPKGHWIFPAGFGGMVNANVLHRTKVSSPQGSTVQLLHLFDPSFLSGEHGSLIERKYILPLLSSPQIEVIVLSPDDLAQAKLLHQIRQAFTLTDDWGYEFRIRNALTEIWLGLMELHHCEIASGESVPRTNEAIKQMMLYIQEHYNHTVSVQEIADAAFLSKRACFRIFRDNLHMTPAAYLRFCRLQKACQMLIHSNRPITDIANACGLGSGSYFGKVFRAEFGCTPQMYRKQWRDFDRTGHH